MQKSHPEMKFQSGGLFANNRYPYLCSWVFGFVQNFRGTTDGEWIPVVFVPDRKIIPPYTHEKLSESERNNRIEYTEVYKKTPFNLKQDPTCISSVTSDVEYKNICLFVAAVTGCRKILMVGYRSEIHRFTYMTSVKEDTVNRDCISLIDPFVQDFPVYYLLQRANEKLQPNNSGFMDETEIQMNQYYVLCRNVINKYLIEGAIELGLSEAERDSACEKILELMDPTLALQRRTILREELTVTSVVLIHKAVQYSKNRVNTVAKKDSVVHKPSDLQRNIMFLFRKFHRD